jgi:GR25 family glycosyltransferase involved in LPS biosynthesis
MTLVEVDKISAWVLNLDIGSGPERWENIKKYKTGLNIRKFAAVNGKKMFSTKESIINSPLFTENCKLNLLERRSNSVEEVHLLGSAGCYLSHIAALKEFLATGDEFAIILEDDIDLSKFEKENSFKEYLNSKVKELPDDWDIWAFGKSSVFSLQSDPPKRPSSYYETYLRPLLDLKFRAMKPGYYPIGSYTGAIGYLISKKGAEIVVNTAFPMENNYDDYLSNLAIMNKLKVVTHNCENIWQIATKSNINEKDSFTSQKNGCLVATLASLFLILLIILIILIILYFTGVIPGWKTQSTVAIKSFQ